MTPILSEHQEQATFFETILFKYRHDPEFVRILFFAVPNGAWLGGKFPPAMMQKMKDEGLTPGVADILYLQPRGEYTYLSIEMKRSDQERKGRLALREDQQLFFDAVNREGGLAVICFNADQAERIFDTYMKLPVSVLRTLKNPKMLDKAF